MVDELTDSVDKNKVTAGVFIDLAKAFDTIDHGILLKKLQHYGIRGVAFSLFRSYLCCRKQYVVLNETKSELLTITCGVPQGSILGPILFLIFINDLNTVSSKLKTIMFADDTNLFSTGNSIDAVEQQLNTELVLINTWFQANLLSLNATKTSFIIFGRKKNLTANIYINSVLSQRQHDTKWDKHYVKPIGFTIYILLPLV